jgi:CBS-domain-containing membrane protein
MSQDRQPGTRPASSPRPPASTQRADVPAPTSAAAAPHGATERTRAVSSPGSRGDARGTESLPPGPLPLPHERDEAVGEVAAHVDPIIRQAKSDIDRGLVDTDLRATPGLDAARRDALVSGATDHVQPAQVPAGGLHQGTALAPAAQARERASTPKESTMAQVSDIMSTDVQVVQPQQSLRSAAQCMRDHDIGALPVCDGERLLGMLTDRDITVRAVADGLAPESACVSDVMSPDVEYCTADQDAQEVMRMMGEKQLRRLPVVDQHKRLVGIVSLGDMAVRQGGHTDQVLRDVSSPTAGAAR